LVGEEVAAAVAAAVVVAVAVAVAAAVARFYRWALRQEAAEVGLHQEQP
jgi:hypothetical protein